MPLPQPFEGHAGVHLGYPARACPGRRFMQQVGTWLSLVERTLGVGEVASSNLVVPTIFFPVTRFPSYAGLFLRG